ncbi:MAG: hypothetical protein QOH68_3410 [Nocardioidaceae bacterium]|jgi:hypothetical protein|nr:hypothetical protein [Nocardioidaceae bacterium]
MRTRPAKHLTYANVMATAAVFIALGGGAYAAAVAKNSVTSKAVKNDSLKGIDIKESTLDTSGLQGPPGERGASGATHVIVRSTYLPTGSGSIDCNPGEVATGGGVGVDSPSDTYVARSEPMPVDAVPTGWKANMNQRIGGSAGSGSVYVVCASP